MIKSVMYCDTCNDEIKDPTSVKTAYCDGLVIHIFMKDRGNENKIDQHFCGLTCLNKYISKTLTAATESIAEVITQTVENTRVLPLDHEHLIPYQEVSDYIQEWRNE